MPEELVVASYPVFKGLTPKGRDSRDLVAEVGSILDSYEVRGTYSTIGFTAKADVLMWLVVDSVDKAQTAVGDLGRYLNVVDTFLGLVQPAEFAKDHLPAFAKGEAPKKYVSVYPFVRTPEWYLLEPNDRGKFLREHGEAGREFPDVLANTTTSFGLTDYEWILAFEADGPERIVELIRRLRATEARRYTKVEVPFYAGIRKELSEVLAPLI